MNILLTSKRWTLITLFLMGLFLMMGGPYNSEAQSGDAQASLKFMTYNVEASGEDPAWMDVVKEENADIIAFVETGTWDDNNNAKLNDYCQEFNNYFSNEDPYNCETTQGIGYDTSGEAIFSRYPIEFVNQIPEVTLDDGTRYDVSHDFFHAAITIGNSTINVIAAHLKCCGGADNIEKREKQQEGIINYMDDLGDVPVIYAGDLNSFSPYDTENKGDLDDGPVSMLLETSKYAGRASDHHQFMDVFRSLNPDDPGFTYGHQNSQYESRIDFIFANQYISDDVTVSTAGDTASADQGSDHYSVDTIMEFDPEDSGDNPYTGEVKNPNTQLSFEIEVYAILPVTLLATLAVFVRRNHQNDH